MTNRGSRTDAEPEPLDTEPVSCHTTSRAAQLKAAPKSFRAYTLQYLGACVFPTKSNPTQEDKTMLIWGVSRLKIVFLRIRRSYPKVSAISDLTLARLGSFLI